MLAIALCIVVIALIQLICVLALIDQYRGLLQIRANLGLLDVTKSIDLAAVAEGVAPSSVGLPLLLDHEERTVAVYLTMKCSTCQAIAEGLRGRVRRPVFVVVEGPSRQACSDWLSAVGLSGDRVLADVDGQIAQRLDLHVSPAALVFESGHLARAFSLPTSRQLQRIVARKELHDPQLVVQSST